MLRYPALAEQIQTSPISWGQRRLSPGFLFCDFFRFVVGKDRREVKKNFSGHTCRERRRRSTVKRSLAAILVVALSGCSGSTRFINQPEPVAVAPPTRQVVQHDLPPAARAEAPKGANESKGTPLMECMSESCRVKCSPEVEKQSRPKWCAYFKEPI
jgi:hypothetical protein